SFYFSTTSTIPSVPATAEPARPIRDTIPHKINPARRLLDSPHMLNSSYSTILVVFSFLVAILASYTSLSMAGQVSTTRGKKAVRWLLGGSFAMGLGIWSMHFIGMLAFSLPIELGYDLKLTVLSLLVAIASSGF